MVQGHLHNDCGGQDIKETGHCTFLLPMGEPMGQGWVSAAEMPSAWTIPSLSPPPGHWGAHPNLSKLHLRTTPQNLSLILDSDACSGRYLTDLWFSTKAAIHSHRHSPRLHGVILLSVYRNVSWGRVDLLPN